jgi:hypothetical protein
VRYPLSVGWLFPPAGGWRGLSLGHDNWRAANHIGDSTILDRYVQRIATLPDVQPVTTASLTALHIPPSTLVGYYDLIVETVAALVQDVAGPY